eukprot:TRINITY_DN2511_c0_g1_i2.p1 TRINITY_DN2511_c0_g1~~TRINITY_DN2511_c0_g1_i2.p1  ORF type:complete len:309 (-),score=20.26 TRINITY_DN2511_c0_g1_i2:38-964(-)
MRRCVRVLGWGRLLLFRRRKVCYSKKESTLYCRDLVRRTDYEHFLCNFFLPKEVRLDNLVLRAFNSEVASIREKSEDLSTGGFKLDWWRKAIAGCYNGTVEPPAQPIMQLLHRTIQTHNLTHTWFKKILAARERDLRTRCTKNNTEELETYAEETSSSLLYLSLETLNIRDTDATHAASHVGKAVGISRILRGTPFHLQTRECYLPVDILAKYNVVQEDLFRGSFPENFPDVIYHTASIAHQHLKHARSIGENSNRLVQSVLLTAQIADDYLHALEKYQFDIFNPKLHSRMKLPLQGKLMLSKWRNKF